MATVYLQDAAREDLIEHAVYLAIEAGQGIAERFLENAEKSFALLAGQPQMGAPLSFKDPRLEGMRKWSISGFDNHLIFYLPRPDGVAIVRVLHGASDWWQLLGIAGK